MKNNMELFSLITGFILGGLVFIPITFHLYSKSQKKTLEKVCDWVYNVGPKFIGKVDDGDYYKFSTDFLTEYKNYIDKL